MSTVHIITPALADARNGNWQTARRWASFLLPQHRVDLAKSWEPCQTGAASHSALAPRSQEVMIALHARRSARSLLAFSQSARHCALVLTGTDLYRDIHSDTDAIRSLELADFLVVLNENGITALPEKFRTKTRVIFQSAPRLKPLLQAEGKTTFDVALIGHVRAEKDPMTALRAMVRLSKIPSRIPTRLIHIGSDKDEELGAIFRSAAGQNPHVVLKGAMGHAATRQVIKRCQILVLPSIMEGGANVLIEAVQCGVPVIASRISGSLGMLGPGYSGYFEVGDDAALAALIAQCQCEPSFYKKLQLQCAARASLFEPQREKQLVQILARELLELSKPPKR